MLSRLGVRRARGIDARQVASHQRGRRLDPQVPVLRAAWATADQRQPGLPLDRPAGRCRVHHLSGRPRPCDERIQHDLRRDSAVGDRHRADGRTRDLARAGDSSRADSGDGDVPRRSVRAGDVRRRAVVRRGARRAVARARARRHHRRRRLRRLLLRAGRSCAVRSQARPRQRPPGRRGRNRHLAGRAVGRSRCNTRRFPRSISSRT